MTHNGWIGEHKFPSSNATSSRREREFIKNLWGFPERTRPALLASAKWAAWYRFYKFVGGEWRTRPRQPTSIFNDALDDREYRQGINFHVGINSDTQISRKIALPLLDPFVREQLRDFLVVAIVSAIPRLSAPFSLRDPGKAMNRSISFRLWDKLKQGHHRLFAIYDLIITLYYLILFYFFYKFWVT